MTLCKEINKHKDENDFVQRINDPSRMSKESLGDSEFFELAFNTY